MMTFPSQISMNFTSHPPISLIWDDRIPITKYLTLGTKKNFWEKEKLEDRTASCNEIQNIQCCLIEVVYFSLDVPESRTNAFLMSFR